MAKRRIKLLDTVALLEDLPGRKELIALRVGADVLAWFRAQGSGWQTRMNEGRHTGRR